MQLDGWSDVPRAPEEVFTRLLDPALVERCLPQCEGVEELAERRFRVTLRAGVGALRGTFRGTVELVDVEAPNGYRMLVVGRSRIGGAQGEARVRLEAIDGGTRLHYEGEARLSGMVAAVGGRLVDLAARRAAEDFFERLCAEIAREG